MLSEFKSNEMKKLDTRYPREKLLIQKELESCIGWIYQVSSIVKNNLNDASDPKKLTKMLLNAPRPNKDFDYPFEDKSWLDETIISAFEIWIASGSITPSAIKDFSNAPPIEPQWKKVIETAKGAFYLDFKKIRKSGKYIYFWKLHDFLKPNSKGRLSANIYYQGDCETFRFQHLFAYFYNQPMGKGKALDYNPPKKWTFPPPNSVGDLILNKACNSK